MDVSVITPAVSAVGALLHVRTTDDTRSYAGTFNDSTFPTGTDVAALCAQAALDLRLAVGQPIPDELTAEAKAVAAYQAAALVEDSFFDDPQGDDVRTRMTARYLAGIEGLKALLDDADDAAGTSIGGMRTVRVLSPSGYELAHRQADHDDPPAP